MFYTARLSDYLKDIAFLTGERNNVATIKVSKRLKIVTESIAKLDAAMRDAAKGATEFANAFQTLKKSAIDPPTDHKHNRCAGSQSKTV